MIIDDITLWGILWYLLGGSALLSIVLKKLRKYIYRSLPDKILYKIHKAFWNWRWHVKWHSGYDTGTSSNYIVSGGWQFYSRITEKDGSYCANWVCGKFVVFSIFLYKHFEEKFWVKILLRFSLWWKTKLENKWTHNNS